MDRAPGPKNHGKNFPKNSAVCIDYDKIPYHKPITVGCTESCLSQKKGTRMVNEGQIKTGAVHGSIAQDKTDRQPTGGEGREIETETDR